MSGNVKHRSGVRGGRRDTHNIGDPCVRLAPTCSPATGWIDATDVSRDANTDDAAGQMYERWKASEREIERLWKFIYSLKFMVNDDAVGKQNV